MLLNFEPICESHALDDFDCGFSALNLFLKQHALTNHKRHLSFTIVGCHQANNRQNIVGFYSLSFAQIEKENLPNKISRSLSSYPVPALRLSRLAVDLKWQKKGYGGEFLIHALIKCHHLALEGAGFVVVVDAKDSNAVQFYKKYGFEEFQKKPLTLFLRIKDIEENFV